MDRAVIDEIRQRVDLVETVGQYVPLKKMGHRYLARCPFHKEKTASFNVNPDLGIYHCFGCKASGDAFKFVAEMEGLTFPEVVRLLAERVGVEVPETRDPERVAEDRRQRDVTERLFAICEAAAAYFERCLYDNLEPFSELARGALLERGVSEETARAFRLGYAPARWDGLAEHLKGQRLSPGDAELAGLLLGGHSGHYDRFRHRLMFPVLDRAGKVVAFSGRILPTSEAIPEGVVPEETGKYINSPETPLFKKGELLYGLAPARMALRQQNEAIVVEGNFDVVQMHQHGFQNTVAPLGTSFTEPQAKLLRRYADAVSLVFDGDDAGKKAARAAYAVCARAGLLARVGVLPPRQDPDTYLRSAEPGRGVEGMTGVLKSALNIAEWLIADAAVYARDNLSDRLAALRSVAGVIGDAASELERQALVDLAVARFHVEKQVVMQALREAGAPRAVPAVEPETADRLLLRIGLDLKSLDEGDTLSARRKLSAWVLELCLVHHPLLGTEETAWACQHLEELPGLLLREARGQFLQSGKVDAARVLEIAPEARVRPWVAARLVVLDVDEPTARRLGRALTDTVACLRRVSQREFERLLRFQSARVGAQGDPSGEEALLNEQLAAKRARVVGTGGSDQN